jgi:hypothetical protein
MNQNSYWDHVSDAAAVESWKDADQTGVVSAETVSENTSLLDFSSFIQEHPEKIFPLMECLRPDFQELFLEYHALHKSQSFLAKTHGVVQTRIWQQLRIIEQAIGAMIVFGPHPTEAVLRPILQQAGLEETKFGSLASMVVLYERTQNYKHVAKNVSAPIPAIRKIFRPAIEILIASKDLKAAALGGFLRNLTYRASLTKGGLSKREHARMKRISRRQFIAPSIVDSPLVSYGDISVLKDTPWKMFEISSEYRMSRITPLFRTQGSRIFGKKAAQIFAPLTPDGELKLGYILARSASPSATRALLRIRGISEMVVRYDGEGNILGEVTVPNEDVQKLIEQSEPRLAPVRIGNFVEVLTGEAAHYCGTVVSEHRVKIQFPSGREFTIRFEPGSVRAASVPKEQRAFWGTRPKLNKPESLDFSEIGSRTG